MSFLILYAVISISLGNDMEKNDYEAIEKHILNDIKQQIPENIVGK